MISVTLEQLINGSDAFKALSQRPLKARTAYAVGKILKLVDTEMQSFNDARMELIRKYGEKDDNNELKADEQGNVHIPSEVLDNFNNELRDLLDTSVELNVNKIRIDDIEDINFTPSEMAQIGDFIEFGEE
jgi:hypothetical protein